ncbi:hypothetical protein [uncultured Endozoicomonas sp.]|uniref:hypothetical protein n=1 Tax=uncultured Endozoicomonas sp. TaxID=432652 RepID=UPI00260B2392|nr:hypothetical protein [uncultured Endozoicomonas sp.]
METTIKALFLGAKVTEFESSRYLKVFLSGMSEDDDPNIYGLDLMICSSDYERLVDFQTLQPLKPYEFRTKVMSGSKQRISIKILGIKKPALEKAVK